MGFTLCSDCACHSGSKVAMCGILAYASCRLPVDRSEFEAGLAELIPRGPDFGDSAFHLNDSVALGHRRLAVLDLNPRSNQPFSSDSSQAQIVFNGEVYNFRALRDELRSKGYRFYTESDTEVVLACYFEYGIECVSRFEGMFAFVIFDPVRKKLFFARDHAGQKPIYYHYVEGSLHLASELKALLKFSALPRKLSIQGLNEYLAYGYVSAPNAILDGFSKLPPGCFGAFCLDRGVVEIKRYWTAPAFCGGDDDNPQLLDDFEELLQSTVSRQLVADVPIAVTLSGGLDSSVLAAIAARSRSSVKTFTVSFPDSKGFDESSYARHVAEFIGSEHHEIEAGTPSSETLMKIVGSFCEPIADNSIVPTYLVSEAIRGSSTVAIGGDGGDELFGGYPHHKRVARISSVNQFLSPIMGWAESMVPDKYKGANSLRACIGDNATSVYFNRYMSESKREALLQRSFHRKDINMPEQYRSKIWHAQSRGVIERSLMIDFDFYLPGNILTKVDRASMAASLEFRAPFLDKSVIEFAYQQVPIERKVRNGRGKILLQELATRVLPTDFDSNRKMGFSSPLDKWLVGPWSSLLDELRGSLDNLVYLDGSKVRSLLSEESAHHPLVSRRIFQLLVLYLWSQIYKIEI